MAVGRASTVGLVGASVTVVGNCVGLSVEVDDDEGETGVTWFSTTGGAGGFVLVPQRRLDTSDG